MEYPTLSEVRQEEVVPTNDHDHDWIPVQWFYTPALAKFETGHGIINLPVTQERRVVRIYCTVCEEVRVIRWS